MSLELFGYKSIHEKVAQEKKWMHNKFTDCPIKYDPESAWRDNAVICRLSLLLPYCKTFGIYQILNREFNDALAEEIKKLNLWPLLEVGAGNGELAATLRARGIELKAVDNYSEPLPERVLNGVHQPEKMDYRDALNCYKPKLALCSWMPDGENWTEDFMACDSVQAYILIGDADWLPRTEPVGWRSRVLMGPNKWSLCRLDNGVDFERPDLWWRHSKVYIFEKDSI